MVEFVESLVLIGFGFALGFVADFIREWYRTRIRRRNVVAMLGAEIKAIERTAEWSVDHLKQSLAQVKKLQEGHAAAYIRIDAPDFPGDVYRMFLLDIPLLEPELAMQVTELYRWIGYAHHRREETNHAYKEVHLVLSRIDPRKPDAHDLDLLKFHAGESSCFATVYLKIVSKILDRAQNAGRTLSAISGRSFDYDVEVGFKEGPVVWHYP